MIDGDRGVVARGGVAKDARGQRRRRPSRGCAPSTGRSRAHASCAGRPPRRRSSLSLGLGIVELLLLLLLLDAAIDGCERRHEAALTNRRLGQAGAERHRRRRRLSPVGLLLAACDCCCILRLRWQGPPDAFECGWSRCVPRRTHRRLAVHGMRRIPRVAPRCKGTRTRR